MRMLKKLIIIENDEQYQYDTLEDIVKELIDENYYNISQEEKIKKMEIKALANCLNNDMEVVQKLKDGDIEDKYIIKDEITYILSLLITGNILLLERIDSNIFTKYLDKSIFTDNYVIVNTFAKELLKHYLKKY